MFKAIVINPNETVDFGCLLAIARAEACRRKQVRVNPLVRALMFVAELGVYIAVYEVLLDEKSRVGNSFVEKTRNQKVGLKKPKVEGS